MFVLGGDGVVVYDAFEVGEEGGEGALGGAFYLCYDQFAVGVEAGEDGGFG